MILTILRKPLEGTVAENTLKHGCGALNIDATRVSFDSSEDINFDARQRQQTASYKESGWSGHVAQVGSDIQMYKEKGRWPANFMLLGDEPQNALDAMSGHQKSGVAGQKSRAWGVAGKGSLSSSEDGIGWKAYGSEGYNDQGGASRYFKKFNKEPK
jgi:hypothetical protein